MKIRINSFHEIKIEKYKQFIQKEIIKNFMFRKIVFCIFGNKNRDDFSFSIVSIHFLYYLFQYYLLVTYLNDI